MNNTIKTILAFFLFLLFISGIFVSPSATLGISLGACWGILNLFFLKQVLKNLFFNTCNKNGKLLLFALIKFPFLYLIGYGLLSIKQIPAFGLLGGFTLVLIGALMKFALQFEWRGAIK